MTVLEAISEFDSLKPNTYSQEQKIRWLDRLDSFIRSSILSRYPGTKLDLLKLGDPRRELIMGGSYQEGYLYWLESKIHYFNEEQERYNGAVRMFRAVFEDYQRSLISEKGPNSPGKFKF